MRTAPQVPKPSASLAERFDLIPSMDQGALTVSVEMPKGTKLSETKKVVDQVAAEIQDIPEISEWYVVAGDTSTDTASINVNLVNIKSRDRSTDEVADEIQSRTHSIPGAKITATASSSAMGMFASSADIQFQINGDDTQVLRQIGEDMVELLNQQEWASEASSSMAEAVPEASITIDRVKASSYGITAASVASAISTAITGSTPTQYKVSGDEIDIRLMQDPDQIQYLSDLQSITVTAANGTPIPLTELAEISVTEGAVEITRINQHRYITISASANGMDTGTARTRVEALLNTYEFPEGYDYSFTGNLDEIIDTFLSLGIVLIVAVLLVYMIMASQFESFIHPLIIMFSLPLGLTGSVFGLFITGNTVSAVGVMGAIMLVGMVVNNAIVLVDYTNQLMARGYSCRDALLEAGPTRLRPILMTTLTTVLGLIPMAISVEEGTEMQRPLAISLMFGLTVSTVVTLVFIPVLYDIVDRFRKNSNKRGKRSSLKEGPHGEAVHELTSQTH